MNSMIAQLDKGITTNFTLEQNVQESETESQQSVRGRKAGVTAQAKAGTGALPGVEFSLGASLGNDGTEGRSESRTVLEGEKDILNKAFHDYALELLTDKLKDEELLKTGEYLQEGDLFLGESTFRYYDFDLIKRTMDFDTLKKIINMQEGVPDISYEEAEKIISKKQNKKSLTAKEKLKEKDAEVAFLHYKTTEPIIKIFEQLNVFAGYASNMFKNLAIIKVGNKIGLLNKKFLRQSSEVLSFRPDTGRKVKFLVRVIGVKESVYSDSNMPVNFEESDIDLIPNMIFDIILGSFSIVKPKDLLVAPIAIYYE